MLYFEEYHQYACPRGAAERARQHTAIKRGAKWFREYNGGVQTEHQVAYGKNIYLPTSMCPGAVQVVKA